MLMAVAPDRTLKVAVYGGLSIDSSTEIHAKQKIWSISCQANHTEWSNSGHSIRYTLQ